MHKHTTQSSTSFVPCKWEKSLKFSTNFHIFHLTTINYRLNLMKFFSSRGFALRSLHFTFSSYLRCSARIEWKLQIRRQTLKAFFSLVPNRECININRSGSHMRCWCQAFHFLGYNDLSNKETSEPLIIQFSFPLIPEGTFAVRQGR